MMTPFVGFPAGKLRFTPIPDPFFTEILPEIEDPAELDVTLYMFFFTHRQRGYPRYMTFAELSAESLLLKALAALGGEDAQNPQAALERGVAKAVARGTLLEIAIESPEGPIKYLFVNTASSRKAVEAIKTDELVLEVRGPVRELRPIAPRPNIFELYEQNIGLLQPLLAQELEEAARDYPPEWIEDAFRIAVERNVRHWRYIRAILERWAAEGRDGKPRFEHG